MAQKKRNGITSSINSNVFDNGNKEIMAAMVRDILADFRDSYFNLLDDQLSGMKFNATQTLQQYLNDIAGSKPEFGTVGSFDIGAGGSLSTGGIISSATTVANASSDQLIEVNFSKSIATRRLIPVITYGSGSNWNEQNDIAYPVIRRISSTRINVALREVSKGTQEITLEIIVL